MPTFTVPRTDHSYVDAHGVTIHYYVWESPKAHAVLQLTHGLGDHARRYEHVAQALVAAGYTVYADDHRGHGATGLDQYAGDASKLGKLGKGGLRAATENIRELSAIIRRDHPTLPLALLGHSWGSLMVQDVLNEHSKEYEVAILTGTAHRTFAHMNSGNLNAKHKRPRHHRLRVAQPRSSGCRRLRERPADVLRRRPQALRPRRWNASHGPPRPSTSPATSRCSS